MLIAVRRAAMLRSQAPALPQASLSAASKPTQVHRHSGTGGGVTALLNREAANIHTVSGKIDLIEIMIDLIEAD